MNAIGNTKLVFTNDSFKKTYQINRRNISKLKQVLGNLIRERERNV